VSCGILSMYGYPGIAVNTQSHLVTFSTTSTNSLLIRLFFLSIQGVRRLRRRASDPKYPEMKALERIFNELEYSSSNVLQDA
jgi:hypothetical protein